MTIIGCSGDAKGQCYQALDAAGQGDLEKAWEHLKRAGEMMERVHEVHGALLHSEGLLPSDPKIIFLLSHAEDIFMSTMTEKELIASLLRNGVFARATEQRSEN